MKLKKIASLMLAGIMAVSMLAGCKSNNNDSNGDDNNTDITPTSATATMLRDKLDGDSRRYLTAVANSDLDLALRNAVDTYYNSASKIGVTTTVAEKTSATSKLAGSVFDAMDTDDSNISATFVDSNDSDKTIVKVYVVDPSVSDAYALEQIADLLKGNIGNVPEKSADDNYDYDYTISASIVTKTETDTNGSTSGVKYIAVAMTQNVTEVA